MFSRGLNLQYDAPDGVITMPPDEKTSLIGQQEDRFQVHPQKERGFLHASKRCTTASCAQHSHSTLTADPGWARARQMLQGVPTTDRGPRGRRRGRLPWTQKQSGPGMLAQGR